MSCWPIPATGPAGVDRLARRRVPVAISWLDRLAAGAPVAQRDLETVALTSDCSVLA